jgi:hypothetical protein
MSYISNYIMMRVTHNRKYIKTKNLKLFLFLEKKKEKRRRRRRSKKQEEGLGWLSQPFGQMGGALASPFD